MGRLVGPLALECRYSTGQGVSGSDARFQMYYETQCQNPVRSPVAAIWLADLILAPCCDFTLAM